MTSYLNFPKEIYGEYPDIRAQNGLDNGTGTEIKIMKHKF